MLKRRERSPVGVDLAGLIGLKPAGESIKLSTPRIRAFAVGGHLSPFKGRGVEFDESRPYQAGDDLRTIDWRVTARTGKPYTKVFREERNRPVIVWLDLRQSMMFATQGAYKAVVAAETAALIGWSAIGNGDQLGALIFSETEHHEQRPRLGRRAALRLLQLISTHSAWSPSPASGSISEDGVTEHALLRLTRVARPGSMMFLCSDFQQMGPDFDRHLRQLASHGDLFLLHIYDPVERELPPPGRYRIDMGGRTLTIDTSDEAERVRYREEFSARCARLEALAKLAGVTLIRCGTHEDPHVRLMQHFMKR